MLTDVVAVCNSNCLLSGDDKPCPGILLPHNTPDTPSFGTTPQLPRVMVLKKGEHNRRHHHHHHHYYYVKVMFAQSYIANSHERAKENNMLYSDVQSSLQLATK